MYNNQTDQSPEEVDGKESHSESDEPHGLHPAGGVKMIGGTSKAEPARHRGQRSNEEKTHQVSTQSPLLLMQRLALQPLKQEGRVRESE